VVFVLQWRLGRLKITPLTWIDYTLAGLMGVLIVSTFTHGWRVDSPDKISPLWLLVSGYVTPALLYLFARFSNVSPRTLRGVYGALTVFGIYLTVTALAEITQQWWLVFPKYISDPKLGIHFGRARGPLLQAHSMGFQIGAALLCGWAWWPRLSRGAQLVLLLILPLTMLALYFTYTRCAWLGAAFCALAVLGLSLRGAWRPLVLAGSVAAGLMVSLVFWDQIVGIEREAGAEAARDSVTQRASFTYVSWKMFLDRPIFGFGFGQFTDAKLPYLSDRSTPLYLEAIRLQPHHNTFLSLLTETGLVGLSLQLALLAGLALAGWRLWRNERLESIFRTQGLVMLGMLGIYLGPALFFDLAYSPNDLWITYFLAGVTMALYVQTGTAPQRAGADANTRREPVAAISRAVDDIAALYT
jgi:O-antigen ligase